VSSDPELERRLTRALDAVPLPPPERWTAPAHTGGGNLMRRIFWVSAAAAVLLLAIVAAVQLGASRRGQGQVLAPPTPSLSSSPTASPEPTNTPTPTTTPTPPVASGPLPAKCSGCVRRHDLALGISFAAPGDWFYTPAEPASGRSQVVLTSTARVSTVPIPTSPPNLDKELLIEMLLVPSNGKDLDAVIRDGIQVSSTGLTIERVQVDGRDARRMTGSFQNGHRVYVITMLDADRVFIAEAYPATSERLSIFDDLIKSIVVLPRSTEQAADALGGALESSDWERIEALMRPSGWNAGFYRSEGSPNMTPAQGVQWLRSRDDDGTLDVTVQRRPISQSAENPSRPETFSIWRNFTAMSPLPQQRVELIFAKQGDNWFWQTGVFGGPVQ